MHRGKTMPEYINRDDMTYLYNNGEYNVFSVNEDAETVNVIRCKDCKNPQFGIDVVYCEVVGRFINQDDYCSWAERKEE